MMKRLPRFVGIIGNEFPADRLTYQKGIATFHPESSEEVSHLFRRAAREEQKLFITGFGNNIDPAGAAFEDLLAVRTDRLNHLLKISPDDFYIVVEAGYPLAELNPILKEFGLYFPLAELPYMGSVGGALAVGLAAFQKPHRLPIGRLLIRAEIILADGEIIKPGSVCFKSVSGFDLVKLFSPSWGLLGLIRSATFRVFPLSIQDEYAGLKMLPVEYGKFATAYNSPGGNVSAELSIKIKNIFDPGGILPLVVKG